MIHATAVIDSRAEIDPSVEIGPWCSIGPHVKIGAGTRLVSHVVLDGHTVLGKNNTIYPFSVLGAPPQDLKYKGEPTELWIGDHNTIRESVTINTGTVQGGNKTQVGSHNLIMATTHLGHDVILGNHVIIANGCALAGHVTVEDYATIGGMNGVAQFVRIGAYCYTGGFSTLEKDIPPYSVAVGVRPCQVKGANLVGLRRKGFASEVVQKINEAIKLWIRHDVPKEQALLEMDSQYGDIPEVQKLIAFIRKSEYGVSR
jgi:UDP-N-acetylglucosamine acyltransferase